MTDAAICGKCGAMVAAGQRFCASCGADVSGQQGNVATAFVSKQDMARATMSATALHDVLRHATLGEYEILAELGRGGMATVYLGHDIALDRKVAIKVMSPALLAGEGMVERFKREARTAASLSHPNIIPIYAVKEGDQIVYFVMKFVEGRPLDSIIKDAGKLPIPMVQQILQQVGSGLGYAHKRGIIHRDVKPANVMMDTDGWAVVTDFGIAKVTEAKGLTMTGATVGTPSYMSPEQCAAKELGGASDQYSLGVVAYEMLAGKLPFVADSIMAIMYAHFNEPPPSILEIRPDCPPAIADAIARMLAKEPGDRFPSVEDAISAIGAPQLTPDDPVRTQLMTLAASNKNTELLKQLSTPVSMPQGRTMGAKATVSTTGGAGFSIRPTQVEVMVGAGAQLTAQLKGQGGKTLVGPRVTWASTAPEIASVSPQGLVTANARGEALITCTCEGASATATITVTPAEGSRSRKGVWIGGGVLIAGAAVALAVLQPWAAKPAEPQVNPPVVGTANPQGTQLPADTGAHLAGTQQAPPTSTPNQPKTTPPGPKPGAGREPAKQVVTTPKTPVQQPPQPAPSAVVTPPKTDSAKSQAPAPPPVAVPVVPQPQPISQGDIRAAIGAYETALESGKIDRVHAAYPSMTDDQATGWRTFFTFATQTKAEFTVSSIQPATGDVATAAVQGQLHFEVQGRKQDQSNNYTARLERVNGVWRITAIK